MNSPRSRAKYYNRVSVIFWELLDHMVILRNIFKGNKAYEETKKDYKHEKRHWIFMILLLFGNLKKKIENFSWLWFSQSFQDLKLFFFVKNPFQYSRWVDSPQQKAFYPTRPRLSEPARTKRKILSINKSTPCSLTSQKYSAIVRLAKTIRTRPPGVSFIRP